MPVEGTTGDNQAETSAIESVFGAGSEEAGNAGTDQEAEQPADKQEGETAPDTEQGEQAPETTEGTDYKQQFETRDKAYRELERRFGQQGNELGQLRKQLDELAKQVPQQKPDDPYEADEVLKTLTPAQRKVFARAGEVGLQQLMAKEGISLSEFKQVRDVVSQMFQQQRTSALAAEAKALRDKVGDENFEKYRGPIRQWYESHDWEARPLEEVFRLVSYEDLAKGQVQRTTEIRKSREERAKSADTGKPGPKAQPSLGPDAESLKKMSNKQAFDEILKGVSKG